MTHEQYIDILKVKLTEEEDFSKIMRYFFDHLGTDETFTKKGKQVKKHDVLQEITQANLLKITGQKAKVDFFLTHIPAEDFFHGLGIWKKKCFTIIFFEDILKGMLVLTSGSARIEYYRFSGVYAPDYDKSNVTS